MVIEQGRWESRRTAWKPHGETVRNIRTVHGVEPDIVLDADTVSGHGITGRLPKTSPRAVMAKHTYFEYEEFGWHRYRSFSATGDGPADVCWPEYVVGPDQRIGERREAYRVKFSAGTAGGNEYAAELDEATWRTLEVGLRCRLKIGAFSGEVKQVTPCSTSDSGAK